MKLNCLRRRSADFAHATFYRAVRPVEGNRFCLIPGDKPVSRLLCFKQESIVQRTTVTGLRSEDRHFLNRRGLKIFSDVVVELFSGFSCYCRTAASNWASFLVKSFGGSRRPWTDFEFDETTQDLI